ncbi:hypothetical protein BDD12DRAFT_874629 [Trichophaea hybrida]|nr:hypothetical protein BDD12DRAFT_874629 [Trichophaea hybrida]
MAEMVVRTPPEPSHKQKRRRANTQRNTCAGTDPISAEDTANVSSDLTELDTTEDEEILKEEEEEEKDNEEDENEEDVPVSNDDMVHTGLRASGRDWVSWRRRKRPSKRAASGGEERKAGGDQGLVEVIMANLELELKV